MAGPMKHVTTSVDLTDDELHELQEELEVVLGGDRLTAAYGWDSDMRSHRLTLGVALSKIRVALGDVPFHDDVDPETGERT